MIEVTDSCKTARNEYAIGTILVLLTVTLLAQTFISSDLSET
jgi:hypothetical protein